MTARDRVRRYRETGGGSDLVRVEVLVPEGERATVLAEAARLRGEHRARRERVRELCDDAITRYPTRLGDNLDLPRITDPLRRAPLIAAALMEGGDARAFILGRRILAALSGEAA